MVEPGSSSGRIMCQRNGRSSLSPHPRFCRSREPQQRSPMCISVRAVPAAGDTLHNAPNEVTLRFSEKLEPKFSSVVDSTGKQVDKGDATVDKADRMVIRVPLQPL